VECWRRGLAAWLAWGPAESQHSTTAKRAPAHGASVQTQNDRFDLNNKFIKNVTI
jgi:hypothetical protein